MLHTQHCTHLISARNQFSPDQLSEAFCNNAFLPRFLIGNTQDFFSRSIAACFGDKVSLLGRHILSLLNFLETLALTSPLSYVRQEINVLCVRVWAWDCEKDTERENEESGCKQNCVGIERESLRRRVGSCLGLYRRVIFKPHTPFLYSLLLYFLSLSLRKPTWPSFLPAHRADSEGTKGRSDWAEKGWGHEKFNKMRTRGREKGPPPPPIPFSLPLALSLRVWHAKAWASSNPC